MKLELFLLNKRRQFSVFFLCVNACFAVKNSNNLQKKIGYILCDRQEGCEGTDGL